MGFELLTGFLTALLVCCFLAGSVVQSSDPTRGEGELLGTMEENPHRPRCKKSVHKALPASRSESPPAALSSSSSSRDVGRFARAPEARECSVDCSGQSCQSCSAALVADCVALCCCPLAVVSLLGLAFIKVPCAMGRRCLGRRKRKEKEKRRLCGSRKDGIGVTSGRTSETSVGKDEDVREFGEKEGEMVEQRTSLCAGFVEADNVLLEMYQVGHLGFGRVSYTGTQPAK